MTVGPSSRRNLKFSRRVLEMGPTVKPWGTGIVRLRLACRHRDRLEAGLVNLPKAPPMPAPAPFTFFHPLRIRWAECDAQGVVFNAQYYFLFDVGMTEYARAIGFAGSTGPEMFTVASSAEFLASARFDEEVEIPVRCARLGNTSVHFEFAMLRDGETLARGRASYVNCLRGTQEKAPLPEDYVAAILEMERTAPER